jgi:hypothetical protein
MFTATQDLQGLFNLKDGATNLAVIAKAIKSSLNQGWDMILATSEFIQIAMQQNLVNLLTPWLILQTII